MISLKQISTSFQVKLTIYIVSTLLGFCRVDFVQISPQQLLVRHLAAPLAHVNVPERAGQDDADRAEEDRNVNSEPG